MKNISIDEFVSSYWRLLYYEIPKHTISLVGLSEYAVCQNKYNILRKLGKILYGINIQLCKNIMLK